MSGLKDVLEEKEGVIKELEENYTQKETIFEAEVRRLQEQMKPLYEKIEELKQENKFYRNANTEEANQLGREIEKLKKVLQSELEEKEQIKKNFENSLKQALEANGRELQQRLMHSERMVEALIKEKENAGGESQRHIEKLLQESERLREEINNKKRELIDKEAEYEKQAVDLRIKNKELKHHSENMAKELEIIRGLNKGNENTLRERIEVLTLEKEKILEKLSKKKLKYKQKIVNLRATLDKTGEEISRGNSQRVRQLEGQLKDSEIEVERLTLAERGLQERIRELELRLSKEGLDKDDKLNQYNRAQENERKALRNDLDVKAHMLKISNDEKLALQEKCGQLEKRYAVLESKYNETEKENKMLFEEVVAFRKELPNLRQYSQTIQRSKVSPSDLRKNNSKSPKDRVKKIVANKIFQLDDIPSGDKESYEPLFSDDLGPAESLDTKGLRISSKENTNSQKWRASDIDLRKKIKDLETENIKYKQIIENMAAEMDNVRNRMLGTNQELAFQKEENYSLRNRIHSLQEELLACKERIMNVSSEKNLILNKINELEGNKTKRSDDEIENLKEAAKKREKDLNTMKEKVKKLKEERAQLRLEGEKLMEISNRLQSKINKLEEGGFQEGSVSEVEKIEIIKHLEAHIDFLEDQLRRWEGLDDQKNELIEKLKNQILEEKKKGSEEKKKRPVSRGRGIKKGALPNYSNFEEMKNQSLENLESGLDPSIESFKRRLDDIRKVLNEEMIVESKKKELIRRSTPDKENPLDNKPLYRPNSDKETVSQRANEEKLARRKKTPPKVRNYNIREVDSGKKAPSREYRD